MTKNAKRIEFFRRYCTLVILAASEGIHVMPYSFHRNDMEQKRLYKEGKSYLDGVKKRSKHQDWLAIDAVVVNKDGSLCWNGADERYKRLYELAKVSKLETGFAWAMKDSNHTQWKG